MIKRLEEVMEKRFLDIGLGKEFLDMTPKTQIGLHQTQKLLHSKTNS